MEQNFLQVFWEVWLICLNAAWHGGGEFGGIFIWRQEKNQLGFRTQSKKARQLWRAFCELM